MIAHAGSLRLGLHVEEVVTAADAMLRDSGLVHGLVNLSRAECGYRGTVSTVGHV